MSTINLVEDYDIACSFCGLSRDEVDKMVGGEDDVAICDECVEIVRDIMIGGEDDE